jgi:hypothetical protein
MPIIFDSAPTQNFNTGKSYYLLPVPSEVILTASSSTRADVTNDSNTNFVNLAGESLTSNRWTFNTATLPNRAYTTPLQGVCVVERQTGVASNTTDAGDLLVCFSEFKNSLGAPITLPSGTYQIPVSFPVDTGALKFDPLYYYTSGPFTGVGTNVITQGIIWMMGTNNGTTIFTNPVVSGKIDTYRVINSTAGAATSSYTDRDLTSVFDRPPGIAFDFKDAQIRVGGLAGFHSNSSSISVNIFGSNYLTLGFNVPQQYQSQIVNQDMTQIGSFPNALTSAANMQSLLVNNNNYYRYLYITTSETASAVNNHFTEYEFPDSTIRTPYENFV